MEQTNSIWENDFEGVISKKWIPSLLKWKITPRSALIDWLKKYFIASNIEMADDSCATLREDFHCEKKRELQFSSS